MAARRVFIKHRHDLSLPAQRLLSALGRKFKFLTTSHRCDIPGHIPCVTRPSGGPCVTPPPFQPHLWSCLLQTLSVPRPPRALPQVDLLSNPFHIPFLLPTVSSQTGPFSHACLLLESSYLGSRAQLRWPLLQEALPESQAGSEVPSGLPHLSPAHSGSSLSRDGSVSITTVLLAHRWH